MQRKIIDRNSVPKNAYTRNQAESYRWFAELQNMVIRYHGIRFPFEVWNKLFKKTECKMVLSEDELDLKSSKRTAIILLGLSCCGKTSYGRALKEKYPSFEFCSFDEVEMSCVLECLEKGAMPSEEAADVMAESKFGHLLEMYAKAAKNIVIDGQFVTSNSRGALIKTLRQIGYKEIIIFNFLNMPRKDVKIRIQKRALEEAMYDSYSTKLSALELVRLRHSMMGKDTTQMLTDIMPIEVWKETEAYKKNYSDIYRNYFEYEVINSGVMFQMKYNLFTSGVDKFFCVY